MSRKNRDRIIFKALKTIEEANESFFNAIELESLRQVETVPLEQALGRVLAEDVTSHLDIPPFNRSKKDGYAVISEDIYFADEEQPVKLKVIGKLHAGDWFTRELKHGEAVEISTGAPIPLGADAVVQVEDTATNESNEVLIFRGKHPGQDIQFMGSDIAYGETIVNKGTMLSQRETSLLAALGIAKVKVMKQPIVGIISTGNEIIEGGQELPPGKIYDINSQTVFDAVKELGGFPVKYGVAPDNREILGQRLKQALEECDIVILSGGTSAGVGDYSYRIINDLGKPGILVHGVLVQPGKPTILAVVNGKPLIGLPGFPTSAMVIFDLFVAPLLQMILGRNVLPRQTIRARIPVKTPTIQGRTQFMFVSITKTENGYYVFPVPGGSGSISTLSRALGYLQIPREVEFLEQGQEVTVHLLVSPEEIPDIMIIGSHCLGLEIIVNEFKNRVHPKISVTSVGSNGGLMALKRGQADISGLHIFDPKTKTYNVEAVKMLNAKDEFILIRGYTRIQGLLLPKGNPHGVKGIEDFVNKKLKLINRNPNSGTRILLEYFLKEIATKKGVTLEEITREIPGYNSIAKTHTAVGIQIRDGIADGGIGIKLVASIYNLDFIPLFEEHYDFLIRKDRINKRGVKEFMELLKDHTVHEKIRKLDGFIVSDDMGEIIELHE